MLCLANEITDLLDLKCNVKTEGWKHSEGNSYFMAKNCLLGRFPSDTHEEPPVRARSWSESYPHHSYANILSVFWASRGIILLLATALKFFLLVFNFPGFCCGGAVLLSERGGKEIQTKAALQDVYSPFYVAKSHFVAPAHEAQTLLTPPLHPVCPRGSFRSRQRLSVSGADGCCRGSWGLTPSTSSPPSAATATTSAPRSPWRLNAAPRPGGRPSAASTCRSSEAPSAAKPSLCSRHYVLSVSFTWGQFCLYVSLWTVDWGHMTAAPDGAERQLLRRLPSKPGTCLAARLWAIDWSVICVEIRRLGAK